MDPGVELRARGRPEVHGARTLRGSVPAHQAWILEWNYVPGDDPKCMAPGLYEAAYLPIKHGSWSGTTCQGTTRSAWRPDSTRQRTCPSSMDPGVELRARGRPEVHG